MDTILQDNDPLLEEEMRQWLRHMAAALISDPDELQRRYDEIDGLIAKLDEDETGNDGDCQRQA